MMTSNDINESLIGKRVEGNFGGEKRVGTVTGLIDDKYVYGFVIKLDKPVFMMSGDFNIDTWYQDEFEVHVRKYDGFDWGSLKDKTIISDSRRVKDGSQRRGVADSRNRFDFQGGNQHKDAYISELSWHIDTLKKDGLLGNFGYDRDDVAKFAEYYEYPSMREWYEAGDTEVADLFNSFIENDLYLINSGYDEEDDDEFLIDGEYDDDDF